MVDTFYTVLQANAASRGSEPALVFNGQTVTHGELLRKVDRLASDLEVLDLSPGDRVALLALNRVESIVLFGACARTGLIVFPINWRLSPAEIDHLLDLAQVSVLFADTANLDKLSQAQASIPKRVLLDGPRQAGWQVLEDLKGSAAPGEIQVDNESPFLLLATAAVEGVSRAALLSHTNLLTAGEQLIDRLDLDESDRHLAAMPFFHITGLELSMATLQAGGANIIMERFDPGRASDWIDSHRVTLLASFPPVLSMLLDAGTPDTPRWSSLRYVLGLDAPDVIQRLLTETNAKFWTGYGQSETSGVVTLLDVRQRPGSAGQPLPAAELRIFDESGNPVPPGTQGEIVVRGPLVFQGYWRDPPATQYASRHGWHHTGDMGYLDDDGYLYYTGRMPEKDLIKSGGENIYPAEVEQAIGRLPQVRGVCVLGVPDETWGETVMAVIELEPGEELSPEAMLAALGDRLAAFKKPRKVEFVEKLPRAADGLIDRSEVKIHFGGS